MARRGGEYYLRSVVRLHSLDNCQHGVAECTNPLLRLVEVFGQISNGEQQFRFLGGWVLPRFMNGNCVNEVIERRPEIVDTVPNDERPPLKRGLLVEVENNAVPGKISISLFGESIRAVVHPGGNLIFDGLSVFFGTL